MSTAGEKWGGGEITACHDAEGPDLQYSNVVPALGLVGACPVRDYTNYCTTPCPILQQHPA